VNVIMKSGKKNLAQRIVYGAFEKVSEKLEKGDPVDLLLGALENARPGSRSRAAASAAPPTRSRSRFHLSARRASRSAGSSTPPARRKGVTMRDALAAEIIDAYNNTGSVVKKKEDTHKMAQANRAFAHLRW
jgi:small subunit ribosomal protein S7